MSARAWAALAAVLCCLAPCGAWAQAWVRAPGEGYASVGLQTMSGTRVFADDRSTAPIGGTYRQQSLVLYTEIGVVERWLMLSAGGELYRVNTWTDHARTRGMGDLQVGATSALVEGPVRLSAGVDLGIPTGDPAPAATAFFDPVAVAQALALPTGDGEVDVTPRLALGIPLAWQGYPLTHYVQARVGARLRTAQFHHGVSWSLELGTRLPSSAQLDRVLVAVAFAGEESSAPHDGGASLTGLGDGIAWRSWSATLHIDIAGGVGVWGRYASAFSARNVAAAAPISLGLDVAW